MQRPLTRNPWLVSGAFLLIVYLLIKAGSSQVDPFILVALWTALTVLCVTMIVHMIRRGYRGPYSQADVMSARWRSWIYDERANRR